MTRPRDIGAFLLGIFLVVGGYWLVHHSQTVKNMLVQSARPKRDLASLRYSNTQTWDPQWHAYITNASSTELADIIAHIHLPPPPENTSAEVQKEIAYLHEMEKVRTPEKLAEIQSEMIPGPTLPFGPHLFGDFTSSTTLPATSKLFNTLLTKEEPIIMREKELVDRVRPSYLDPTLTTAIPIPGHPAYPSGHSSQAHLMANLASFLDPQNHDAYFASALRIAQNREVAGLHYPSDTAGGKALAEQFFNYMKNRPDMQPLFDAAQKEWKSR